LRKLSTQTKQNTTRCVLIIDLQKYFALQFCIAYSVLDYFQVVPGAIPPEVRSSTLLILECFVLGVDHSLFVFLTCGSRLVFIICYCCFVCYLLFFLFQNTYKNKKVTREHGLGLIDPNALQTKNGSGIILINSYNLKYTKS
jgi:hypothetical protein